MTKPYENKFYSPDLLLIPRVLVMDRKIKMGGAVVYGVIYWFFGLRDGVCTASNATIAKVAGMQRKSVSNIIAALIRGGYVESVTVDGVRNLSPLLFFGAKRTPAMSKVASAGISCRYCGVSGLERPLVLDHFIPKSKGGPTTDENLVLCCAGCNADKGQLGGEAYIEKLKNEGRYLHLQVEGYPSIDGHPVHPKVAHKEIKKRSSKKQTPALPRREVSEVEIVAGSEPITEVIAEFQKFNPAARRFYAQSVQRDAAGSLVKRYGLEQTLRAVQWAAKIAGREFAKSIQTPVQLEQNWHWLASYLSRPENRKVVSGPSRFAGVTGTEVSADA